MRFLRSCFSATFGLLVAVSVSGCAADEPSRDGEAGSELSTGRVGFHGIVLFGDRDRAFLSHIATFDDPHDVQAIVEVKLSGLPANAPASFSDRLYTFTPEIMSLDAFRRGEIAAVSGTVHLGGFWEGGLPIARGVRAETVRVVRQHVLRRDEPAAAAPKYFLFGTPERAFAAHRIAGDPTFDHIAAVTFGARRPTAEALARGIGVTRAGAADREAERLGPGAVVTTGGGVDGEEAGPAAEIDLDAVRDLACLRVPGNFVPCS